MKKLIQSTLLAILALLLTASVVLAQTYYAMITVLETGGTNYAMYPAHTALDTPFLVDNGYIAATGLDTRVQDNGTAIPHMLATSRLLFASAIAASSSSTFNFYTGEAALVAFDIITGYNGYITIPDAAALEPGNNFEFEIDGYVDTTAGTGKNLIYKAGAFIVTISDDTDVTAAILAGGTTTVNLLPDGDGDYTNIPTVVGVANHWDAVNDPVGAPDDGATLVRDNDVGANQEFDAYTLQDGIVPIDAQIASVTVYFRHIWAAGVPQIQPGLRLNGVEQLGTEIMSAGVWTTSSEALTRPGGGNWQASDFDDLQVLIGLRDSPNAIDCTQVYVAVAYYNAYVTVTGVTADDHTINVEATGGGTNLLIIDVDAGAITNNVALGGASVPNNTNDWYIGQNNVLPYYDYFLYAIGGAPVVHYEPNTYIRGQEYAIGTATFTNGSVNITGVGTSWNEDMEGGMIRSDVDNIWQVVDQVTSATTLTLTAVYAGAGGAGHAYTMAPRMPDREGAAQDGIITWGNNPTGLSVLMDSLTPYALASALTADISSPDVAGEVYQPEGMYRSNTEMQGVNQLFYFIAYGAAQNISTPIQFFWWVLCAIFIILAMTAGFKYSGSNIWMGGLAAVGAMGACIGMALLPGWMLIIGVLILVGAAVWERTPTI